MMELTPGRRRALADHPAGEAPAVLSAAVIVVRLRLPLREEELAAVAARLHPFQSGARGVQQPIHFHVWSGGGGGAHPEAVITVRVRFVVVVVVVEGRLDRHQPAAVRAGAIVLPVAVIVHTVARAVRPVGLQRRLGRQRLAAVRRLVACSAVVLDQVLPGPELLPAAGLVALPGVSRPVLALQQACSQVVS